MTLDELTIGSEAYIESINCAEISLKKHILDMGMTPGTEVTLVKAAPMGDPLEFRLRDYELTLRREDAACIGITNPHKASSKHTYAHSVGEIEHPHTGEAGVYHVKRNGNPIPEDKPLRLGLAGNQNSGKTSLFNQLTGSNQHVGNFPGVTVERKDGIIRNHPKATVTDLPGIYSLSPYTSEEIVTREFFLKDKPQGIINILDATNIERNLYLTVQILELGIPTVIALNMMDEVRKNGGTININLLEKRLGVPVVPISAAKNEGITELAQHALHIAKYCETPGRQDFYDENGYDGGAMHRCIHAIIHLIEDHAKTADIPLRFAASKVVEGDELIIDSLKLDDNEKEMIERIINEMEDTCGKERQAALADMRFSFIESICNETVIKPQESKEHLRSVKIDRVLTGKYTALPLFAGIMILIFWLTFGVIGSGLSDLLEMGIERITYICDSLLSTYGINPVVHSLVIDGVFAGVGSVLSFMPIIVVLFFFLSILEDTGYMARVAFVMDKLLRRIGLSGRSFVPMLIGFGCSVPAIMSTRTLPSDRDRKMTIMLTPFMSCSAKVPIYAIFTSAFFPHRSTLVMVSLYFGGIITAVLLALLLKKTAFTGKPVPFVMELPNYRLPTPISVWKLICDKAKDFITRAFTIIFIASIIIWFLQSFDLKFNVVTDSSSSMLAQLGSFISPVFSPLGFGDWRASTSLITGFMAKESVVSTFTVLLGTSSIENVFTITSALPFLTFTLLYTPCVAAIASVRRELGGKWAVGLCLLQCIIAWIVAFVVRMICLI